jgi:hypothetical protein
MKAPQNPLSTHSAWCVCAPDRSADAVARQKTTPDPPPPFTPTAFAHLGNSRRPPGRKGCTHLSAMRRSLLLALLLLLLLALLQLLHGTGATGVTAAAAGPGEQRHKHAGGSGPAAAANKPGTIQRLALSASLSVSTSRRCRSGSDI